MAEFIAFLGSSDIFKSFVASILAAFGLLIAEYFVIIPLNLRKKGGTVESYGEKLERLVDNLTKTSREVDNILIEIAQTTREREATIKKLESEIRQLELSEKEYKERIDALKSIPIPAIDHLIKQMEPSEKRSARRDYLLFLAGVIASLIISIVLNLAGFGN